jgi:uncharacterized protein (DUF2252 family)
MSSPDVIARIQQFNQGRHPERLKLKYQAMAQDAFVFLQGTCHLFYQDLPTTGIFQNAPPVWVCGDLHLQNFGTFKGDDRLVYFDVNDFDEAMLAPCTWEIARLLTSIFIGTPTFDPRAEAAQQLCTDFLDTYITELKTGKSRTVHGALATGLVKELLENLKQRRRKDFLNARTDLKGKRLKLIPNKIMPVNETERPTLTALINAWASHQANPDFYTVLDVAHRIAGTGSLGGDRYVILVQGSGSPHGNYLLDLKAALPSSLQPYVQIPQPTWQHEADRITAIQYRCQESPPALLNALALESRSFVLRELQPTTDRVNLMASYGKIKRLQKVIKTMAKVTAWGQFRSSGRQGSAIADELMTFAADSTWHQPLLEYVQSYAGQVEQDYQTFKAHFRASLISA